MKDPPGCSPVGVCGAPGSGATLTIGPLSQVSPEQRQIAGPAGGTAPAMSGWSELLARLRLAGSPWLRQDSASQIS